MSDWQTMCFRSQHVTIDDEEKMPNLSNLRRSTARNCGSTARTSGQSAGCRHPNCGFRCYNLKNISGGFEANCVVAKAWPSSPVRCKHILCLLLACIALSAAGADIDEEEVTYSGLSTIMSSTDTPAHPLPEQYANIPVVKRDRRELKPFKSENEHVNDDHNVNNEAPSPSHEGEETHTATDGHRQDIGPVSLQIKNKADNLATESKYFIMRLFRRYNSDHYLLTKDLEKLLENIGLGRDEVHEDDHTHHDHDHTHEDHDHTHEDHDHTHGDHDHTHGDHDHTHEDHDHTHEDHDHTHEDHDHTHGDHDHTHEDHDHTHEDHDHAHEDHDHAHDDHDHSHNDEVYDGNEIIDLDLDNNHSNIDKDNQSGDKSNAAEILHPQSSHKKQAVKQESDLKSTDKLARRKRQTRENVVKHQHVDHDHCLSAQKLLEIFRLEQDSLNPHDFLHLCPALIDQLDAGYCGPRHDGHNHDLNQHHLHTHEEEHHHSNTAGANVWLYAQLSVAVISLCSIAGVVVIPNMKRTFYNHILQFLVALAIGTMCGDAMLHLLPHALLSETHHETHHHEHHEEESTKASNNSGHEAEEEHDMSQHMSALYKGLVGLIGMYGFFFLERLFTLFTNHRSTKQKRKSKRRRLCSGKSEDKKRRFHMVRSKLGQHEENAPSCEEMVMVVHANKALKALADVSHDAYLHQCDESLVLTPSGHDVNNVLSNGNVRADAKDDDTFRDVSNTLEGSNPQNGASAVDREPPHISDAEITGITKDQEEPIHSHSHLAQDMNGPLSSVAFMIVIGDMVHNFCDGLAIGAAFAGSVAGGLSTSVAVFCHELPHEIGDFAVLVRSGLSMRKAVGLNLLSSIPCFIGAVIGLVVGNVGSASLWIFAAVGGMFLYIALVDLIPEMTSVYTKTNEPWFLHLLLQASGIALGTTIMLIISVSEESLLTAFDDFHDTPSHP